jgi:metallo-beta-lactamase superfamily protein
MMETIMSYRAPELSRRGVLSGLVAATASGLAQPAFAAGPMANVQVPAAYRFKLGGFECTVVSDGPLKLGTFSAELFKGISQERIDEIVAANFLDKSNFTVDQNALVVNTGGKLVLIDTGMGFREVYGPRTGHLLSNLRAASIDPASIDIVALSHGHPDHVWGLVAEDGRPNFPNAQIYITQADLEYWTDEAKLSDPALGH